MGNNKWLCIECGIELGDVLGGELTPDVHIPANNIRTRGPNLVVVCPKCGATKVWYTADAVVRAMYQLIDAMATSMARRALTVLNEETPPRK